MEFYRSLYVGQSITKVNKIKWRLYTGAGAPGVYLICLSANQDQLDIFPASQLKQKYFDRKRLRVVGLAADKGEAYQLVGRMLADTLADGMEGDIKGYLTRHFKQKEGSGR